VVPWFAVLAIPVYIVPRFVDIFSKFDVELPAQTQWLLAFSRAVGGWWPLMWLALLGAGAGLVLWGWRGTRAAALGVVTGVSWLAAGAFVTLAVTAMFGPLVELIQNMGQGG
jgi:type II secretory pathway component PulF